MSSRRWVRVLVPLIAVSMVIGCAPDASDVATSPTGAVERERSCVNDQLRGVQLGNFMEHLLVGDDREWESIVSLGVTPVREVDRGLALASERWNESEERAAARDSYRFDPYVQVDVESRRGRERVVTRHGVGISIQQSLRSGAEVWVQLSTMDEIRYFPYALAIDRQERVRFRDDCVDRAFSPLLERLLVRIRDELPSAQRGLSDGTLVRSVLEDPDGPVGVVIRELMTPEPEPPRWEELPPDQRSIQEAPLEVLEATRSVVLWISTDQDLGDAGEWMICTSTDHALTGCLAGGLLDSDQPFLFTIHAPDTETWQLRIWAVPENPVGDWVETVLVDQTFTADTTSLRLHVTAERFEDLAADGPEDRVLLSEG